MWGLEAGLGPAGSVRPQPRPHAVVGSPGPVGGASSHLILPPSCKCVQEGLQWRPRGPGQASSVPGLPGPEEAGWGRRRRNLAHEL